MKAYHQAERPAPDMEWLKTTQEYSKLHLQKTACETFLKKETHFGENKAQKKTFYHDKKIVFKIMHKNTHVCLKHTCWEDCNKHQKQKNQHLEPQRKVEIRNLRQVPTVYKSSDEVVQTIRISTVNSRSLIHKEN